MKTLLTSIALLGILPIAAACSGSDTEPQVPPESIAQTTEPITGSCTLQTLGLVCDPDGPTGALQECQGLCFISATTGQPACVASMNTAGRSCGSTNGVGACDFHCQGGSCIPGGSPGAACRPTALGNACDGACTNAGLCLPIANACKYGVDGCVLSYCNGANASQCVTQNLTANTPCDDSNDCTIGDKCVVGGVCSPGGPKACSDVNVCTDDTCTPATGACVHTPNTSACSDNNACTNGDTCSAGTCKAGTTPTDCDDNNACTADSCNAPSGCVHAAKNCSDNDTCTTDACDPATGNCSNTPIPGCGIDAGPDGAAGGGSGGTAGGGGVAGSATGGAAGSATGGAAGSAIGGAAGAATGGAAGSGGTAGGSGGTAGSGNTGGSTGGSGGSAGGSGGSSASGGSGGGSGGLDGGVGGKKSTVEVEDEGGCGCRVPAQSSSGSWLIALFGLMLTAALRRRRR